MWPTLRGRPSSHELPTLSTPRAQLLPDRPAPHSSSRIGRPEGQALEPGFEGGAKPLGWGAMRGGLSLALWQVQSIQPDHKVTEDPQRGDFGKLTACPPLAG